MNGASNGAPAGGWASDSGWDTSLDRLSPTGGLRPLNVEHETSAPVPSHVSAISAPPPVLGRATSSKKCILLACFATAATIALGVGLGVGLGSGGGSSGGSGGGDGGNTTTTSSTAVVYGTQLSSSCEQLATTDYWDVVNVSSYGLQLQLADGVFDYNASAGGAGYPPSFEAQATLLLAVQGASVGCLVLNARNLTFSRLRLQERLADGSLGATTYLCGGNSSASCAAGGGVVSQPFQLRASDAAAAPLSSEAADLVALDLGSTVLQPGSSFALLADYSGLLGAWPTATLGLLRSAPYASADGKRLQVMVATQGEPTGTRQLLPCYDAPARKATFEVTLQVPSTTPSGAATVALSNMAVRSKLGGAGDAVHVYEYEPTPVMSPYLLAIAAGDMVQYASAGNGSAAGNASAGGVEYRLWAAPGLEGQLEAAAAIVPAAFAFYAAYFSGVPLPPQLTKWDLVAVPGKSGAMENWGLILLDEARFLYDEAWEGAYGRKQLALVLCHEIAHQWVGNLATKQDWAMLSVDEGLASLLEYKCLASLPGFQGQGDVHFFRGSTPQLQNPGFHEAPGFLALQYAADPTSPPMVAASDADMVPPTGGYMQYSKPAALIHSHELYLRETSGGMDVMPSLLQYMLRQGAYRTWNWSEYFVAASATLAAANTTASNALVRAIEGRAGSFMRAQSYQEVMDIIASGAPTMATWFYSTLYPIATADAYPNGTAPVLGWQASPADPPAQLAADPTNATLLSLWNYNQSVFELGATARPFCAYQLSGELAQQLGVGDAADKLQAPCVMPSGRRYFPLTTALDNLTACASEAAGHAGAWSLRYKQLIDGDTWVTNQQGATLVRTVYEPAHLGALVAELSRISAVCAAEADNATCCTRPSDLLEGASALNDALALAQTGEQQPLAAGLNATAALRAVQGAVLDTGATRDGSWQYLIARAGLDAVFTLKRYAGWVEQTRPECSSDFDAFTRRVFRGTGSALDAEWLQAGTVQNDTLKQLIGPRLLWPLAFADTDALALSMCSDYTLTPLWARVLDVLGGGEGDVGVQPQPGGFDSNAPSVSPDLLPALYMVGAALPAACNSSLLGGPGVSGGATLADLAAPTLKALQRCYLTDPSPAEASRCLYAMPWVAVLAETADFQQQPDGSLAAAVLSRSTLPWLAAAGNGSACAGLAAQPELAARCARRAVDLAAELPALTNSLTRPSSDHLAAFLRFAEDNWGAQMCGLLAAAVQPMNQATYDQLVALLETGPAKDCPAAYKVRIAGMAEQTKEVGEAQADEACDYLAQQLQAWASEGLAPAPAAG